MTFLIMPSSALKDNSSVVEHSSTNLELCFMDNGLPVMGFLDSKSQL